MLELDRAIADLTRLLQETACAYGENARITRSVREQLGKAYYYATWTLKTNSAPEEEWLPFAERARQLFRYLAEWENPQEFAATKTASIRNFRRHSSKERKATKSLVGEKPDFLEKPASGIQPNSNMMLQGGGGWNIRPY